jgi:hypothetical protein
MDESLTGGARTSRWQNGKERGAIAMGSEKSVAHPTVAAPVAAPGSTSTPRFLNAPLLSLAPTP